MSKQIDFTQPLSDFDREYLIGRNMDHLIPTAPVAGVVVAPAAVPEPVVVDAPQVEDVADDGDAPEEDTSDSGEATDPGYGSMTAEELKALLTARELPVSGSKGELIGRLVAADKAASA